MKILFTLSLFLVVLARPRCAFSAQVLHFSGYDWTVNAGFWGPGPNHWDTQNVFLDKQGHLHLKITQRNGQWYCAEVTSTQRFGFGRYQWQIAGRLDQLDPNVVLGLFNYPTPDIGPDGTNEIDIEFARWGKAKNPAGNYTVWPPVKSALHGGNTFDFKLSGDTTTHYFEWSGQSVAFASLPGYRDDDAPTFGRYLYAPENATALVPQKPLPVHLNFWLFRGQPPLNGRESEIVIASFKFTPAQLSH
ncbi:MAG: glycoside hydrolase family 16 protein [Abitibacteriaceae bacterium]|nr:glycoside hydrolase family 16 protein [Abditibacteriaceae bacterium]MBV9866093.1 glycoside hydrolase family 16 protein [Abditibacteriaceae bacterium]